MQTAIEYTQKMQDLLTALSEINTEHEYTSQVGRRFDRVLVNGATLFFVDRHSWDIFGAKSSFQYNPRRWYGTLADVNDMNWNTYVPNENTDLYERWYAREVEITSNYKPRGRPRKNPVTETN